MNIWEILGISPTCDAYEIKKAYREQLKSNRPEDDQSAFIRLREAYELALEYAKREEDLDYYTEESDEDYYHTEENDKEYYDEDELSPEYEKFVNWTQKIEALYKDYFRRNQEFEWEQLLFNDIPYQLQYYKICRQFIFNLIYTRYSDVYLCKEVSSLINEFFEYSRGPMERAKSGKKRDFLTELNRKIKISENIRFDKMNPLDFDGMDLDYFFYMFNKLISNIHIEKKIVKKVDEVKKYKVFYLPLEALHIYAHWEEYSLEEISRKIDELNEATDSKLPESDKFEIELLKAKLAITTKDYSLAKKMLKELYMKVCTKDYLGIYLLCLCCKEVEMYYEAYMLIKQLTWLNPQPFMYEMADNICNIMTANYMEKLESGCLIDDLEHIHICRMYLRANREKEAIAVLERVNNIYEYQWEYEVAHAMCIFYEDSISVPNNIYVLGRTNDAEPPMAVLKAKPVFEILLNFSKDELSNIDRLEWRELQARYLFEQRKYSECEELCNELLEEYPISYPILTLRAYVDYNAHTFGLSSRFTEYMDFTNLINVMPQRSENRRVVAQVFFISRMYDKAVEVMEPIKDIYPDCYRCYDVFSYYGSKDIHGKILAITDIFAESLTRELDIPPVSKYRLLDLKNIFVYVCNNCGQDFCKDEHIFNIYTSLKDSAYNNPKSYVDLGRLYEMLGDKETATKLTIEQIKRAPKRDRNTLYTYLIGLCDNYNDANKYSKYAKEGYTERTLGYFAYDEGRYELAIEHLKKAIDYNDNTTYQARIMYQAYYNLRKYEEAIETLKMAIRKYDITGNCMYKDTNNYNEIAKVYIEIEKYEDALKYLELGRKYYTDSNHISHYYYLLGLCYSYMGNDEKYIQKKREAWREAVERRYYGEVSKLYCGLAGDYARCDEYENAIEVINIGLEITGDSGDFYDEDGYEGNLYFELMRYYQELDQYDNVYKEACRLIENSRSINMSFFGYKWKALVALIKYRIQEAYDNYKIAYEMQSQTNSTLEMFSCMETWQIENYFLAAYLLRKPEAKEIRLSKTESIEVDEERIGDYLLSLRAEYISTGGVDKAFASDVLESIQSAIGTVKEECIYGALYELSSLLGKETLIKKYKKLLKENMTITEEVNCNIAWHYIYTGEYEKAYELYDKRNSVKPYVPDRTAYEDYNFVKEKVFGKKMKNLHYVKNI